MKLTLTAVSTPGKAGRPSEDKNARMARMKAYWATPQNATLYPLGKLLAQVVGGKTLAETVYNSGSITLDSITLATGQELPISPAQEISLGTITHGWGCPACHSAHGSGVYPSRDLDSHLLAKNVWYYNPSTKQVHVISDTCYGAYVQALGAGKHIALPIVNKPAVKPVAAAASKPATATT